MKHCYVFLLRRLYLTGFGAEGSPLLSSSSSEALLFDSSNFRDMDSVESYLIDSGCCFSLGVLRLGGAR